MDTLPKVTTSGIDHIHLNVNHLQEAITLFTNLFDCTHNIPLHIDSIDGVNSMNSLRVDVIAPASSDGYFAKVMEGYGGEGISAVSFYVEDIDDATARIEAKGLKHRSKIGYPGIELQTQFAARDSFGMSIELVYLYPDAEEKIAAIKADQAKDNDGETEIQSQPGAVASSGIDHVRLRVKDVTAAVERFANLFESEWTFDQPTGVARSSLGIDLMPVANAEQKEGIDALGIRVDDLAEAAARVSTLQLQTTASPSYLDSGTCLGLHPTECFGISLVLVEK